MPTLTVFNSITLDGYFTGAGGDLGWAHTAAPDPEWQAFVSGNAGGNGMLLFGRVTYDMMIQYWPTPMAAKNDQAVAEGMNRMAKLVFSRTLEQATWQNTRLVKTDPAAEVRRLKAADGPDMVLLGSGTIVSLLAQAGLIDIFQLVVVPVAIGKGRTMFEGITKPLKLTRTDSRSFRNGNVVVTYRPAT